MAAPRTGRCALKQPPLSGVWVEIPRLALVLLVGAAGAGKSTFARAHFKPTQVLLMPVA